MIKTTKNKYYCKNFFEDNKMECTDLHDSHFKLSLNMVAIQGTPNYELRRICGRIVKRVQMCMKEIQCIVGIKSTQNLKVLHIRK